MGKVTLVLIDKNRETVEKEIFLGGFELIKIPFGKEFLKRFVGGALEIIPNNLIVKNTEIRIL